ncbi:hypothetical protein [Anaerosinus massiliensis]|uniref:hypothetical protein n=1 Tax=Massilibacillus massiliensis TaxID=1806837 RepID=UPI000DA602A2|nr:hypothetical protein [Massilibacillus massiliensis]
MNKQTLNELVSLLGKMQKNKEQQERQDVKALAQKLILACNSIENKDLQTLEEIVICVDQYSFTRDVLSKLTSKEIEELFPIQAAKGSQEYKTSKGFLGLIGEILGEDLESLYLYCNNQIQKFVSLYYQLDEAIGKMAVVEFLKAVNQYQLRDIPTLPKREMLEWYENVRIVYQLLLKLNISDIVQLFPSDSDNEYIINLFNEKSLGTSENLDMFIVNYNNTDLQEFILRLWFVQSVAEKYQEQEK